MEISLEKIELVKDRTGVGYREAKEALEACDGNVVDAIIYIEDNIDESDKIKESQIADILGGLKKTLHAGNVSKIVVSKGADTVVNIPVNAGIIGTILSPLGAAAALIAAFRSECKIEIYKTDGEVVDVSAAAGQFYENAKLKGGVLWDEAKDKGTELYGKAVEKGSQVYQAAKDKVAEAGDSIREVKEAAAQDKALFDSLDAEDETAAAAEEQLKDDSLD